MSEIQQDVAYLASTVGARPAGTEEEQLAASYMNQHLSSLPGISSEIEEFSCAPRYELLHGICFGVAAIISILACISSLFLLPAFILTLVCAIPVVFDAMGRPLLNRVANQGISQNVVAKFVPQNTRTHRTRKIILMASIDSPLAQPERAGFLGSIHGYVRMASVYAAIALPVIWLLRWLFASEASGAGLIFWQIVSIIGLVLVAIPAILAVVHTQLPLPEGANSNASGIATIMEVARQVSAQEAGDIFGHENAEQAGEDALRAQGLIPDGAEMVYESEQSEPEAGSAESIALAKAALAEVTGEKVADSTNDGIIVIGDVEGSAPQETSDKRPESSDAVVTDAGQDNEPVQTAALVVDRADELAAADEAPNVHTEEKTEKTVSGINNAEYSEIIQEAPSEAHPVEDFSVKTAETTEDVSRETETEQDSASPEDNVPDWFKSAQEKAKRNENKSVDKPAKRSRYADALDAALGASSQYFARANEVIEEKAQAQLDKLSHGIKEIKAPEGLSRMLGTRPHTPVQTKVPKMGFDVEPIKESAEAVPAQADDETIEPTSMTSQTSLETADTGSKPRVAPFEDRFEVQTRAQNTQQTPVSTSRSPQGSPQGGFGSGFSQSDDLDEEIFSENVPAQPAAETLPRDPQATVAMPAIDAHSQYEQAARAIHDAELNEGGETSSLNEDDRSARARALQWQPSRWVTPAQRRSGERVVIDAGDAVDAVPALLAEQNDAAAFHDFSVIDPEQTEAYTTAEHVSRSSASRPRTDLDLPTLSNLPQIDATQTKQAAPIAQAEERHFSRLNVSDLSAQLPRVTTMMEPITPAEEKPVSTAGTPEVSDNKRAALGSLLPSMSGTISEEGLGAAEPESTHTPVAGMTGAFAPVAETLTDEADDQEFSLDDVDESAYVNEFNEEAIAPGYVEMPESRIKKFFSRFSRKNKRDDLEYSHPNEWLDVDENFNPTRVGAERGGWDSFREDEYEDDFEDTYSSDADKTERIDPVSPEDTQWKGGAFSKVREQSAKLMNRHGEEAPTAEEVDSPVSVHQHKEPTEEAQKLQQAFDQVSSLLSADEREQLAEETRLIYGLRGNSIDIEVWFVGLGADNCGHAGMSQFIETHKSELRGATFINLDGMGAGALSVVKREGIFAKKQTPIRVTRILHKAVQLTGLSVEKKDQIGEISAAYVASHSGHQAFSLIGADESGVALCGQSRDTVEEVSAGTIAERAGFIMRFIENI